MKFTANTKELQEVLESVQVKGKGTSSKGFGQTSLGTYVYLVLENGSLNLWNGNPTFFVNIQLEVNGEENGEVILDSSTVLPYLKTFGDNTTVTVTDFIQLSSNGKRASIPIVVNHPTGEALTRIQSMLNHIHYQPVPQVLFQFSKTQLEGAVTITQQVLQSAIKNCEIVKSGVYKFDFKENVLNISSNQSVTNKYEEVVEPAFFLGEPATVEFSSPLYAFFKKGQLINIYLKDESPILMVAEDRMLLKAPNVG